MIRIEETFLISQALQRALTTRRFKKNMSYRMLSHKTGADIALLKSIERGEIHKLDFLLLTQIANVLDCNVSDLLDTSSLGMQLDTLKNGIDLRFPTSERLKRFLENRESISRKLKNISADMRTLRKRRLVLCSLREKLINDYYKKRVVSF